jgi:hypothetical protein
MKPLNGILASRIEFMHDFIKMMQIDVMVCQNIEGRKNEFFFVVRLQVFSLSE